MRPHNVSVPGEEAKLEQVLGDCCDLSEGDGGHPTFAGLRDGRDGRDGQNGPNGPQEDEHGQHQGGIRGGDHVVEDDEAEVSRG